MIRVFMRLVLVCLLVPTTNGAEPKITAAPSGKYQIIQQYHDTNPADPNAGGMWTATLRFAQRSKPDATLAADPDWYGWPAEYDISPDERWILRVQKTGSGENCALLYRVESNGRVSRVEPHLDDLAFAAATAGNGLSREKDYYHTGVAFGSWDTARQLIHLKVFGAPNDKMKSWVEEHVDYHLKSNEIVLR